ncbi:hypothetical protein PpBr36_06824 [Pyricularia pennisetigena]|uniref:hypothetical protein n=1 Tax=Pyricularia pennisetigena TaxID=1578925 RepID=UPI00115049FE|nr:hypothetical protein PpBr36_06824 [Pyricularia pennisetigena]TLS25148.1 hypothetical protein PpBr36_06824 [Pyricularia pennisetigena]
MISTTFAIFNATKILILAVSCVSILVCIWTFWSYCRGGHQKRNSSNNQDLWGWSCVQNRRSELFKESVDYALLCRLQDWTVICIIIEIVVDALTIGLYSIVVYRLYSLRRLQKSMDRRDKARMEFYSVKAAEHLPQPNYLQYSSHRPNPDNDRSLDSVHGQGSSVNTYLQPVPIPAAYANRVG